MQIRWTRDEGFMYRLATEEEVQLGIRPVKCSDSFIHEALAFARRQYNSITDRAKQGIDDIEDPLDGYLLMYLDSGEVKITVYRVNEIEAYAHVADLALDRCQAYKAMACCTIDEVWAGPDIDSCAVIVNYFRREKPAMCWMMEAYHANQIVSRQLLDPICLRRPIVTPITPVLESFFNDNWWIESEPEDA
eukprot:GEMP01066690.1.p1 GENE.GEMP01066690.1~~GEMP01066690.1.p1  ORF type:complete len:191 (+),score=30.43 GEMP01066690.1:122-694(+)